MPVVLLIAAMLGQTEVPGRGDPPDGSHPAERQERFDRFFAAADADGDGLLSKVELQAALEAELQAAFRAMGAPPAGRPAERRGVRSPSDRGQPSN